MSSYFNVARKYRKKPDLTPVMYDSQDFFSVPRRYNFAVPPVQTTELPNKSRHLNDIIKKLILMYLSEISVEDDYSISGDTLYTLDTDIVVGSTLTLTAGRGTVEGNKLIL